MYEKLVKQFGYCEGMVGKDEDNDSVIVSIDKKCATIRTLQDNGWARINVYWKDGTVEEYYQKQEERL